MPKPPHILLVDDDPITRRLFGSRLADTGFEVLYAKDGNEGREMARRLRPNLVIMDYRMPVMDGLKAAEMMKSERVTANIPIILLTNVDFSQEAQQTAKSIGIDDYIYKGVDINEFIERVKKFLPNGPEG